MSESRLFERTKPAHPSEPIIHVIQEPTPVSIVLPPEVMKKTAKVAVGATGCSLLVTLLFAIGLPLLIGGIVWFAAVYCQGCMRVANDRVVTLTADFSLNAFDYFSPPEVLGWQEQILWSYVEMSVVAVDVEAGSVAYSWWSR